MEDELNKISMFIESNSKGDRKLNFGCGTEQLKGFDNMDREDFDFQTFPYPIKDNIYDFIYARCIFEHLLDIKSVLFEFERICKNDAIIYIVVPYYANFQAWSAFDHVHAFNESAFTELHRYGLNKLKTKEVKLIPSYLGFFIPFRKFFSKYINGLIKFMEIEMKVVK